MGAEGPSAQAPPAPPSARLRGGRPGEPRSHWWAGGGADWQGGARGAARWKMAALAPELLVLSDAGRFRADNLLGAEDWGRPGLGGEGPRRGGAGRGREGRPLPRVAGRGGPGSAWEGLS